MGDNDVSHYVEQRLTAIEQRLDALDGGPDEEAEEPEPEKEEDPIAAFTATTTRGRRGSRSETTEGAE